MAKLSEAGKPALRNRALLLAATEFHSSPAAYVHQDHLGMFGIRDFELFRALKETPRGERRLSRLIAERAGLPREGIFEFTEPRYRLALLPFSVLEPVLVLGSAATLRNDLARIIDRGARSRLESEIGAQAWFFALKEAPMLLGEACRDPWSHENAGDLLHRWQRNRVRLIEDCLGGAPSSLTARMRLKLPPSWDADFSIPSTQERTEQAWQIVRKILKAKSPEGSALCFA